MITMAKTQAQRIKKHGAKAVVVDHTPPPVIKPAAGTSSSAGRSPEQAPNNSKLIVIAGVVASLFLFWYLHLLTLNQMTQLSGGMAMPDSLTGGFSTDYITHLHAAMDDAARGQLSYLHKTAGTLFPLIFGFSWLLLIGTNVSRRSLRRAMWAAPLLFVVAHLWSNIAIDSMVGAATPDAGLVALASAVTVASWVLFLLSILCGAAAVYLGRKRSKQARAEQARAEQRDQR